MSEMNRERDLVLNPNEYAYVLDKTKGLISCVVGSYKMSLSTSDALVVFNENTKRFEEASYGDAVATFVSAPENWYIELKNPVKEKHMQHPTCGTANTLPEFEVGKKINIRGNTSFALYPGQMAKVIRGHSLHSNQYLLAKVYDADVLNAEIMKKYEEEKEAAKTRAGSDAGENESEAPETFEVKEPELYTTGQILVIKGTENPFYIPPTGIEVIPIGGAGNKYVRNAVTLEKLEYCILKNEKGVKKYIHGDAVVFPQPDEVFLTNPQSSSDKEDKYKYRAIELSDISGIYVKVIADYTENGKSYKAGEELFISGKDQRIYYPRPEHAIIDYEGRVLHHAIEIPAGEGRYILDRMKGDVKLVKGPVMYLPDPRTEVVVQRRLSRKECELWYPGNKEALAFNVGNMDDDDDYSHTTRKARMDFMSCDIGGYETGFSRSNQYTEPRTIVIDNKYKGAVAINVWTGYAINVVSKSGQRKVVKGPATYLLEYDETLESVNLSTGKPKTTDHMIETVYLRVDNNKVSDIINVQTKDFVDVSIKVSYCIDFLTDHMSKWFNVENYVKYMCDRERSLMKMEAKKHDIEDFYKNTTEIVRNTLLNLGSEKKQKGRLFEENGMLVKDVEVLSVNVEDDIRHIINNHQYDMVEKALNLTKTEQSLAVEKKIAELEKERVRLSNERRLYELQISNDTKMEELKKTREVEQLKEANEKAEKQATMDLQELLNTVQKAELARKSERDKNDYDAQKRVDELAKARQEAYAKAVKSVIESIGPELTAALVSRANADMLATVAESMAPYAIAKDESIPDTVDTLMRGTSLEGVIGTVLSAISKKD